METDDQKDFNKIITTATTYTGLSCPKCATIMVLPKNYKSCLKMRID